MGAPSTAVRSPAWAPARLLPVAADAPTAAARVVATPTGDSKPVIPPGAAGSARAATAQTAPPASAAASPHHSAVFAGRRSTPSASRLFTPLPRDGGVSASVR